MARAALTSGAVQLSGPVASQLFGFSPVVISTVSPTDAIIQVHFGTDPSRPLLTFRSQTPVNSPFGPLRLLQISPATDL